MAGASQLFLTARPHKLTAQALLQVLRPEAGHQADLPLEEWDLTSRSKLISCTKGIAAL